jgi:hypothetical protein
MNDRVAGNSEWSGTPKKSDKSNKNDRSSGPGGFKNPGRPRQYNNNKKIKNRAAGSSFGTRKGGGKGGKGGEPY